MEFGLRLLPTDLSIGLVDLAREAEARGFTSFWVPEHTHIPVSRQTPFPSGPSLPPEYKRGLDPFVALATVAAATSLQVGTGVCLLVERDPILLAKSVASLDLISGGRFLFGIGAGWNREEMANHGTAFEARWAVVRDRLAAIKAIWANEAAEYHSEHVNFDPIWQWPKPVQKPHPPILLGGDAPGAIKRAVELADEWIPHPRRTPDRFAVLIDQMNALAAEHGRPPLPVSLYGVPIATDFATFAAWQKLGIKRVVLNIPSEGRDVALPLLDQAVPILREFGG